MIYTQMLCYLCRSLRGARHECQWRSKTFDMRTGIRLLIGALICLFARDGEAGPFDWLAHLAWFGRGWGNRIAADAVWPALLTRADVFVIWERNVDYVKCYWWCSWMNDITRTCEYIYIVKLLNCRFMCVKIRGLIALVGVKISSYAWWLCRRSGVDFVE